MPPIQNSEPRAPPGSSVNKMGVAEHRGTLFWGSYEKGPTIFRVVHYMLHVGLIRLSLLKTFGVRFVCLLPEAGLRGGALDIAYNDMTMDILSSAGFALPVFQIFS